MRTLLILFTICLVMMLGSSSPIDPQRWLVNRPSPDVIDGDRRANHQYVAVKGKGGPVRSHPPLKPEYNLRKGEYIRNGQVFKLKPGEKPKNCPQGMCQYAIRYPNLQTY